MDTKLVVQHMGLFILAVLLSGGCGARSEPPTPIPPTATLTPIPPTSKPTQIPAPPTSTPTLTPTPSPLVQDIRTLCLETKGDLSETIFDNLRDFLEQGMKLQVWALKGRPCDAILSIALIAEPLGGYYYPKGLPPSFPFGTPLPFTKPMGSTYCYNGAQVNSQLSLSIWGFSAAQVETNFRKTPPQEIGACLDEERAPFYEAWPRAVLDGLAHFWGPGVYVQALSVPGALGRADIVSKSAIEALTELSGEDYGDNTLFWEHWLANQRSFKPFVLPQDHANATLAPQVTTFNQVYISDSFDDNSNEWSVGEVDGNYWVGTRLIVNGVMDWYGTSRKGMFSNQIPEKNTLQEDLSDLQISIKAKLLYPSMNGYYGLTLRSNEDNDFYTFIVDGDGNYAFCVYSDEIWTFLIDWKEAPQLKNGEWNKMTVQAVGNHFRLYINDNLISEIDDSTLTSGQSGVIVGIHQAGEMLQIQFDDFEVRVPL